MRNQYVYHLLFIAITSFTVYGGKLEGSNSMVLRYELIISLIAPWYERALKISRALAIEDSPYVPQDFKPLLHRRQHSTGIEMATGTAVATGTGLPTSIATGIGHIKIEMATGTAVATGTGLPTSIATGIGYIKIVATGCPALIHGVARKSGSLYANIPQGCPGPYPINGAVLATGTGLVASTGIQAAFGIAASTGFPVGTGIAALHKSMGTAASTGLPLSAGTAALHNVMGTAAPTAAYAGFRRSFKGPYDI